MKTLTTSLLLLALSITAFSQKKEQDKTAIAAMCGCYEVSFDYAETFASDTNYEFHDQYHTSAPAEWVFIADESDDKLALQHLLVINDTMIIKHWRQDWVYQNQAFYEFHKGRQWNFQKRNEKEVNGQWTQKVYQVDDSPRYEGSASWVHVDGQHYWMNTSDAPLPRREYSKRSDYNVMKRTNKHILTDDGWLHEQDNLKVVREEGKEDSVVVAEKGLNHYRKIDDSRCEAGRKWWEENGAFWALVRAEWDEVFAREENISLAKRVDNKMLWQALFELSDEMKDAVAKSPKKVSSKIEGIITSFLVEEDQANAGY